MNPPSMLDDMSAEAEICYVPLLFGYSNYSRAGYRRHRVEFGDIPVAARGDAPRGSIIGGVGLGVSRSSAHIGACVEYAKYVASPAIQRGEYLDAGGQPASAAAWHDAEVNAKTGNFFANTWRTLDGAQVRPRHAGFPAFQDVCGQIIHDFLVQRSSVEQALDDINRAWQRAD
jgi:multiple sugar transport system substrate-binding protein